MKKLKYILILSLLLLPVSFVNAANDVSITANTNITLTSPAMTLVLGSGSSYRTMTVTASTIAFTVSPGGSITLTSSDRYNLSNDRSMEVVPTCGASSASVVFSVGDNESEDTVTFTPSTLVCDASAGSSTSGSGQSGSGASSTSTAQPATGTQSVSKTVGGSSGGSVATSDNKAGVSIPAGLATGNISMNIVPKDSTSYTSPVSGYSAVAGQVYDFSVSTGGNEMTSFSSPVTLTFKYTDSDITGLDENTLQVYYRDSSGNWVLAGGSVDKANNTVTVEVSHFTIFGVFGQGTYVSTAEGGDLIKLQCPSGASVNHICKSVYYLGSDSKRYVFPNEITYFSWYADFSDVVIVASDVMSSYAIGGNVTIRPGTYMVKITTDPKVYAVEPGGKLRWVNSETAAQNLYGNNWTKKIVDVADTFFVNYDASEAVSNPVIDTHPIGTLIKYVGGTNVYYISSSNVKRLISTTGFSANNYRNEFIIETNITYGDGATIAGAETTLNTTAGL